MIRRFLGPLALLGLLLAVTAPVADAHTETLAASSPAAGSVVRSVETIELRFVDRIRVDAATFTLRSGTGTTVTLAAPAYADQDRVVTLRPAAALPDGRYRVGFQVLFPDGDPAAGVVEFEVSADGVARAPAWTADDPPPAVAKERFSAGAALPWLLVGAAAAVGALAIGLARSRRRERALDALADRAAPGQHTR